MPVSAASAGCVDFVLEPEQIAAELTHIASHPYVGALTDETMEEAPVEEGEDGLRKICVVLRRGTGVDFRKYRPGTIRRRVARRMALHKLSDMDKYFQQLRRDPGEVNALFQDMLVHVTGFFRDSEAFEALRIKVLD